MIKIDVVCPLYKAENYIDNLIESFKNQQGVVLHKVVFAVTEWEGQDAVIEKIVAAGYTYFVVSREEFSHSLTRQRAIYEFCESDVVVMISQDVSLCNNNSFYELAKNVTDKVVFCYGKQICRKKTIEYYVRKKNYGDENLIVSSEDIERLQLKTFFASDAFSAYHRPTFLKVGGYDNIHMMMSEDMYYAKKIIDLGYKKGYISTAVVEHSHNLKLKQLYKRYYDTGVWFAQHPEFDNYKTTDSGMKLAFYVLGQALIHCNIPVLFRWLPDMTARYLGMTKGKELNK